MKVSILGVEIDNINLADSLAKIEKWIWNLGPPAPQARALRAGKHYIVTPNLEFILAAQDDPEFRHILNNADLAIPDSSSLGLSYWLLNKHPIERFILWPLFFIPIKQLMQFDVVTGTDLMDELCKVAAEKGFTTGFLGGSDEIAKKTTECLQKKYPKLKINFVGAGGKVDSNGNSDINFNIPPLDILFVAFGHVKQEKWIANNLKKIPVKVAMGVGGAFDYLSGSVPRAPKWIRSLGLEWLFRLIVQPWRITRQFSLLRYVWLLTISR